MSKITRILLKKELFEIFRGWFFDQRKNKARSAFSTVLMIITYIVLMVGVLGFVFGMMAHSLCGVLVSFGFDWLYFVIMGLTGTVMGAFGSVFSTYSGLYLSKDNQLLLAMPIPVSSLLTAKLSGVYILGLMYSAIVTVPFIIVYFLTVQITPIALLFSLLMLLMVSLVVMILCCLLGFIVAKISQKFTNRSFTKLFITLLFLGLYYYFYFNAKTLLNEFLQNYMIYGEAIRGKAYPLYLFGKACTGDGMSALIVSAVILALTAITVYILIKSFTGIVTATNKTARVKYKEKLVARKSAQSALLRKEFARFTSSANYMLNCGFGTVFMFIGIGALIFFGADLIKEMPFAEDEATVFLTVFACLIICMLGSMNDMVVPSVSLEGKHLWIVQSLPVSPLSVIHAKMKVQLIITLPPVLLLSVTAGLVLNCTPLSFVFLIGLPVVFIIANTCLGMFLALIRVNLNWTNEIYVIKQGLTILIAIFAGSLINVGLMFLFMLPDWFFNSSPEGAYTYLALCTVLYLIIAILFYTWVKKKGTKVLMEL